MIEETVILTKSPQPAGLTAQEAKPMMKNQYSLFAFRCSLFAATVSGSFPDERLESCAGWTNHAKTANSERRLYAHRLP